MITYCQPCMESRITTKMKDPRERERARAYFHMSQIRNYGNDYEFPVSLSDDRYASFLLLS